MIDKRTMNIINDLLHRHYPDAVVLKAVDWNKELYVVAAPDYGNLEELDPFYSIDKRTGEVKPFYMGNNLARFDSL